MCVRDSRWEPIIRMTAQSSGRQPAPPPPPLPPADTQHNAAGRGRPFRRETPQPLQSVCIKIGLWCLQAKLGHRFHCRVRVSPCETDPGRSLFYKVKVKISMVFIFGFFFYYKYTSEKCDVLLYPGTLRNKIQWPSEVS